MTYANNPQYTLAFSHECHNFYVPANVTEYHASRYVEMNNQMIYANAGVDKDTLRAVIDKVIELCNDDNVKTVRTDVGSYMNMLKYRTQYPVDEKCSIRMGCLLCFTDNEPNEYNSAYQANKMSLATQYPEVYAFFLTMGISNIKQYREHLDTLNVMDYFNNRRETMQMLIGNGYHPLAT